MKNTEKFSKSKRKIIEDNISSLKDILKRDMNDHLIVELIRKLGVLSYDFRNIVLDTWENNALIGKKEVKKKTNEETECNSDEKIREQNKDIKNNNSKSDKKFYDLLNLYHSSSSSENEVLVLSKRKKFRKKIKK